ncbi:uncharacterized protein LOC110820427 [Carica papaya]|uniref:uncharacterized protein LOC110820427 n=1 Tax=Carica papaya TaxID=3649 RepID=UPI000B8C7CF5|nr:uncharacterized protein LOC110820427 [Carica papaya]
MSIFSQTLHFSSTSTYHTTSPLSSFPPYLTPPKRHFISYPHQIPNQNRLLVTISTSKMASTKLVAGDERAGAEIVYGAEECYRHSIELLEELGFPKGVLPLQDLEECGRVRETGFVWMKQKQPYEHFFVDTNTRVSYSREVTAYVEKRKMKKMTGVKSKQLLLWVPITEMSIDDPASKKIHFKTPMGIGKSFPIIAFMTDEEKHKYLENANE